ncbi:MAG: cytochrome c biogenesis protein CcdA [Myxococcales bacterium]|nr:cytochrome c biogenesis protein CcdA [Myxococcales bacterium]
MLEEFAKNAGQYIHTNPWLAVVAVFIGGMITASNPCVLAMIPLMMSFVAGRKEESVGPLKALGYSLAFVFGLSITFTVLGVAAALTGSLYGEVSGVWNWVVAGICLVMGLHLLGAIPLRIPVPAGIQPRTRGVVGAFVLGLLFGVVSAPCAAPILIVLLTYLASSGSSVAYGATLLLVYGLGHSVLILIAGTSMGAARKLIESRKITRATDIMRRVAGALVIAVGAYFAYLALQ